MSRRLSARRAAGHAATAAALAVALLVAACDGGGDAAPPPPATPDREASTYFGCMILVDHAGPKGQIHLESQEDPLWFPSVTDTVAFTRLPGEANDIVAIYVSDMAAAENWEDPGTWMPAEEGWYVLDSGRRGGMGAPEAVPFATRAAADAFAAEEGGRVVAWDDIPDDYVLGGVPGMGDGADHREMPQ